MKNNFWKPQMHKFSLGGHLYVLDVNSSSLHQVDNLVWELLDYLESGECPRELGGYDYDSIVQAWGELQELVEAGLLWTAIPEAPSVPSEKHLKSICLNVAHDCNLRCRYCFAATGHFGGGRSFMSFEVGKKAIDMLIQSSGPRKNLAIDFFGGEPLLNWNETKRMLEYAQEAVHAAGKSLKLTLTTNATGLTPEIGCYLKEHHVNVVLSLDGRPEIHNSMRATGTEGRYEQVKENIGKFLQSPSPGGYYVRGTFTHQNLDFSEDALHLANLGYREISLEPVISTNNGIGLEEGDLPQLEAEYERLALAVIDLHRQGRPVNFYHFNLGTFHAPCLERRIRGCGAGQEYVAVTPTGEIYPCHQLVGEETFLMGTVNEGIARLDLVRQFNQVNILTKDECRECWARFYCSGGCYANSYTFSGEISGNYPLGCRLQKKRIECALAVSAEVKA